MEPRLFLVFEKAKALHLHLGGYFDNLELQRNFIEAIDFLKSKSLDKMMVDFTKLEVLKDIDQIWLKETWYPGAIKAGLKKVAFVVPKGFMKNNSIAEKNKGSIQGLNYCFFENPEEALEELNKPI